MPLMSFGLPIPGMMLPMTHPMQARPLPFPLASALLWTQAACIHPCRSPVNAHTLGAGCAQHVPLASWIHTRPTL